MTRPRWREIIFSDLGMLLFLALSRMLLHALTNQEYGFHRDELGFLDDARSLAWGYVTYPPFTPFVGRIALELFGPSTVGVRFFSSLAQGAALVLTGLMAGELGGKRWAVLLAGLAVWIAPVSLIQGALFQYVSFDYLWWVLAAYCMLRLLKTGNFLWWLGIGTAIGLGMMTRFSMAFCVAGIVGGVLLTPARRSLKSRWLWGGAGLALLIFLPNLIWQLQHNLISLQHLSAIHIHDMQIGRTDTFVTDQFMLGANPFTIPFWLAGLNFYLFSRAGSPYRALGWMYVIPFLLLLAARGRGYYLAPAYPMLLAAGSVAAERWLAERRPRVSAILKGATWASVALGGVIIAALALPLAPVNSAWWDVASNAIPDWKEEIGWPELTQQVAQVRAALPEAERAGAGILTNNYGEAGAIDLYGPALGLPDALSGVNTHWLHGYGAPPPQTLIVIGYLAEDIRPYFETCELAGRIRNAYQVENEESKVPDIFVCRSLRQPWPEFWQQIQHFG
jgi:hypothetical protein